MKRYDVCIIGGGPAGYAAAMRATDFDKTVLLVERNRVGGAGIYDGALSSKTFWELSREIGSIKRKFAKYGMVMPPLSFANVVRDVDDAVRERARILVSQMHQVSSQNGNRFTFVNGSARLLERNRVAVTVEGREESIHADYIILATGSRPRAVPGIPVDERTILTSDGISHLQEFPQSIAILGAGVIGCEFATIFSNFGTTKVHLIARDDRILPFEDADISRIVETNLEDNGVTIHRNAKLESMRIVQERVQCVLAGDPGEGSVFEVEKALVSVGRVPNVEGMGFDTVGLRMSDTGHIIDDDTQCNVPNIYAVGDLTADIALVNVGELEGRHAVEKIFGRPRRRLIYENISTIMFLNPETAGVGMNEQQAQSAGLNYRCASFDFRCIPRATAMRRTQGFFKILVTDEDEMKILGMRAIGEHASSAIQAVALLISMDKGIEELAELIHPHPSIIEGVQECVRMLLGTSILKPSVFSDYLVYRRFQDGRYVQAVP